MMHFELIQTASFQMEIGYSEVYKRDVYRVRNLQTGVVEFENPMYATAREMTEALQSVSEGEEKKFVSASSSEGSSALN